MTVHARCHRARRTNEPKSTSPTETLYICTGCGPSRTVTKVTIEATYHCCTICTKDIRYFEDTLVCGHHFHGDCLWRWLKKHAHTPKAKDECPLCGPLTEFRSRANSVVSNVSRALATTGSRRSHRKASTSSSSSSGDDTN
ncbi:hypothetical protein HDE_10901 [Halotydeus destructor]|nr:hypothetical protein HDE_10901 [Halotydeus destructor]